MEPTAEPIHCPLFSPRMNPLPNSFKESMLARYLREEEEHKKREQQIEWTIFGMAAVVYISLLFLNK
jgi:hypothetical protein